MLIADIRIPYTGGLCSFFFQYVKLQVCTRAAVCNILQLENLAMEEFLKKFRAQFHEFACDGGAAGMSE